MLLRKVNNGEFMVRFVAMGWRQTQTAEALAALLNNDAVRSRDPNVRSEAANSLSMFGTEAIADLVAGCDRDDNWLVSHSLIAPLYDRLPPKIDCQNALLKIRK